MQNQIIAVCGGSGSGKSTITRYLAEKIGYDQTAILSLDHYYIDRSDLSLEERSRLNFDSPDALDLNQLYQDLLALKRSEDIFRPQYCFKTHSRLEPELFQAKKYIFLDGILSLHHPDIRRNCDSSIYVTVPADLRFIRRLERDITERARDMQSVISQYLRTVRPMHEMFVSAQKKHCKILLEWVDYDFQALDRIYHDLVTS